MTGSGVAQFIKQVSLFRWSVFAAAILSSAAIALAFSTPARADIWEIPGTAHAGQQPFSATLDTHNHTAGPSILYSTFVGPNHARIWRLNPYTAQSTEVLHDTGSAITDLNILPNGDIVFHQNSELVEFNTQLHRLARFGRGAVVETTTGTQLTIGSVSSVSVDSAGNVFVLAHFTGTNINSDFVAEFIPLSATGPSKVKLLAGGGTRGLPVVNIPPQPADDVDLTQASDLVVHDANNFALLTPATRTEGGEVIGGLQVIRFSLSSAEGLKGEAVDVSASRLAINRDGTKLFTTLPFYRVVVGAFDEPLIDFGVLRAGSSREIGFGRIGGGNKTIGPVPLNQVDVKLPNDELPRGITPIGSALIVALVTSHPTNKTIPLVFDGAGPSEDQLLKLLADAKAAAARGDVAAVQAIHDTLVRTESRAFKPTPSVINDILLKHHLLPNKGVRGPTAVLNKDVAGLIGTFVHETERPYLLIPLRARMAIIAGRALGLWQ